MNHWAGKAVLVTGGAGFIGHGLVLKLVRSGAKVTVVDDFSKGDKQSIGSQLGNIKLIEGDLLRKEVAHEALSGQEVCFHFAARIGGIGYFHKIPATILRDNSVMNLNLWDAAIEQDTKMVCLSSSMVFESTTTLPTPESALEESPPPVSGYGFSKLVSEYIAKTYKEQFGIDYLIVRPFNAYGPGEMPGEYVGYSHVIPDLVKKTLSGSYPLEILGDGNQTRSFTYVDDITDAILFLAERYRNDDFNIGNPQESTVLDIAKIIWQLCGRKEEFKVKNTPSFAHDVSRRVPDVTKILATGWKPKVHLQEGLTNTITWLEQGLHDDNRH